MNYVRVTKPTREVGNSLATAACILRSILTQAGHRPDRLLRSTRYLTVLRGNTESRSWFNPLSVGLTHCPGKVVGDPVSVLHPEAELIARSEIESGFVKVGQPADELRARLLRAAPPMDMAANVS